MVTLSDKTVLEFKFDLMQKQVIVLQKGEVGVEMGKIILPMADLKEWGAKFKGLSSLFSLDILK